MDQLENKAHKKCRDSHEEEQIMIHKGQDECKLKKKAKGSFDIDFALCF